MPRVNLGKKPPPEYSVRIQTLIDYGMHLRSLENLKQASRFLKISETTLRRCYKDPGRFRVGELISILDRLNVPESERGFLHG